MELRLIIMCKQQFLYEVDDTAEFYSVYILSIELLITFCLLFRKIGTFLGRRLTNYISGKSKKCIFMESVY